MKAALIIIDLQKGLFESDPTPYEALAVIERINLLADQARELRIPVIYVQHEYPEGFLQFESESWRLHPQLTIGPNDHVIRKATPDCFLRTELGSLLSALAVQQLIIGGYATEFCIDTSVRRAAALGFPVLLLADGHTTHDKPHASAHQIRQHHNATLADIQSFGPVIQAKLSSDVNLDNLAA